MATMKWHPLEKNSALSETERAVDAVLHCMDCVFCHESVSIVALFANEDMVKVADRKQKVKALWPDAIVVRYFMPQTGHLKVSGTPQCGLQGETPIQMLLCLSDYVRGNSYSQVSFQPLETVDVLEFPIPIALDVFEKEVYAQGRAYSERPYIIETVFHSNPALVQITIL